MSISFVSLITERELFGSEDFNLVAFAEEPNILDIHSQLLDACDIIQARFLYTPFLLEASEDFTRTELETIEDAFEVNLESNLFCIPFNKRLKLSDGNCAITTFNAYCEVFSVLNGKREGDLDDLWEDLYENKGFLTFRLILK